MLKLEVVVALIMAGFAGVAVVMVPPFPIPVLPIIRNAPVPA